MWSIAKGTSAYEDVLKKKTDIEADDLRDLMGLMESVLDCEEQKGKLMGMQSPHVSVVLDLLQIFIDGLPSGSVLRRRFGTTLLKLSSTSGCLPRCLVLDDVARAKGFDPYSGTGIADIWLGTFRHSVVALKRLRAFGYDRGDDSLNKLSKALYYESLVWRQLNHPFVHIFCGISFAPFERHSCLVSPFMQARNVMDYLEAYPSTDRQKMLLQIAEGLRYLHDFQPCVIHGKLQGTNILVNSNGLPQITDFGLLPVVISCVNIDAPADEVVKATAWMAPEYLGGLSGLSTASDVYSFGCVCFEVFTGNSPYSELRPFAVSLAILDGVKPARPSGEATARGLTDTIWSIMENCWNTDPRERPSMKEIIERISSALGQAAHSRVELGNSLREERYRHTLGDFVHIDSEPAQLSTTLPSTVDTLITSEGSASNIPVQPSTAVTLIDHEGVASKTDQHMSGCLANAPTVHGQKHGPITSDADVSLKSDEPSKSRELKMLPSIGDAANVPYLQGAVAVVCLIMETAKAVQDNRADCVHLANRAVQLIQAVYENRPRDPILPAPYLRNLRSLEDTLEKILHRLTDLHTNNAILQPLTAGAQVIPVSLQDCDKDLDLSLFDLHSVVGIDGEMLLSGSDTKE